MAQRLCDSVRKLPPHVLTTVEETFRPMSFENGLKDLDLPYGDDVDRLIIRFFNSPTELEHRFAWNDNLSLKDGDYYYGDDGVFWVLRR